MAISLFATMAAYALFAGADFGGGIWDMLAARRAHALGIGLLSGGYGRDELERAAAYRVFEDPAFAAEIAIAQGVPPREVLRELRSLHARL